MRVMNGRLYNFIRSPLTRNRYLIGLRARTRHNNDDGDNDDDEDENDEDNLVEDGSAESDYNKNEKRPDDDDAHTRNEGAAVDEAADSPHKHQHHHRYHRHRHHHHSFRSINENKIKTKKRGRMGGLVGGARRGKPQAARRRSSDPPPLPKSIQFDESSEDYRCLCGCFHIKTGALCITGIEAILILCYFLNALTVLLQQKQAYGSSTNGANMDATSADYMPIAFAITSTALALSLVAVLLAVVSLTRNIASLLIPHLIAQALAILCFAGLVLVGVVALFTDHAYFYRLLNAAPFNDYPGQTTVALDAETMLRVQLVLATYLLSLILELWFIVIIYNAYCYLTERRKYMNYCLAYSTPMKTLNSARYN